MYRQVFVLLLSVACAACGTALDDTTRFGQELEQLLDSTRSPCQDFYGYVCARSSNADQTLRLQRDQQRFQQMLRSANPDQLLAMEQQLLNFYKSCRSSRSVEALRISQLYKSTGGWPALETRSSNRTLNWLGLLGYFHEMGAPYFFDSTISMQSNKRLVTLQPDTTRRHTVSKFEQRMADLLKSFGVEQSRAHVASLEVLSLERNRREIVKTERSDDQVQYSYANFKSSTFGNVSLAQLDWDGYFKQILGGKSLRPTDVIVVKQLPRLVDYMQLLQNTNMHRLLNWIWIDYLMDIAATDCKQLAETYAGDVYAHLLLRLSVDRERMTEMYAAIGRAYKEQLSGSVWIDEISEQASQRFLNHIMHVTISGDERLDAAYRELDLGRRNFYRNMEKLRRFQHKRTSPTSDELQMRQYAQIFETVNGLLPKLNLSMPLNYVLVGERFARNLIAAGSSTLTPGAWRSIDSDRQFAQFQQCSNSSNPNELLLAILGQRQTGNCYRQWLGQQSAAAFRRQLTSATTGQRLQLSLERLYFIGSLLVDCRELQIAGGVQLERKRQLQHTLLRNSATFSEAFNCRPGDALYSQQPLCKIA
ncbi:uncharacterized protein LOC6567285 [Drosophila grimshawi]|uniref:GH21824 n=1 Tax=Drosophila grimshawi TaxID=7222 RepID=B4JS13_DROGR|nr:uncharacterized protein LOC6567285 [Drosophila grimshawi]EDV94553.1 GH21824 [Drosophila grimshawi]